MHEQLAMSDAFGMSELLYKFRLRYTVDTPLTEILYSGHLIIQDKMLRSGLNLH